MYFLCWVGQVRIASLKNCRENNDFQLVTDCGWIECCNFNISAYCNVILVSCGYVYVKVTPKKWGEEMGRPHGCGGVGQGSGGGGNDVKMPMLYILSFLP